MSQAALQAEADELHAQAPNLPPCIVPHGHEFADLLALAEEEGKAQVDEVAAALQAAARGVTECQICGRQGVPSTSTRVEADELGFTAFLRLIFETKSIQAHRGAFTCGRCRAATSTARLLQLASPAFHGSGDADDASRWV